MTIDPVDFAGLMCARLCHDLLSPVGALGNGIELLADEEDPARRAQCLSLLEESARATAHKLTFFRLAFGASGSFADRISVDETAAALKGYFGPAKALVVNWLVDTPDLPKWLATMALNLGALAGDALVRGGQIDIGMDIGADQFELVVRADGDRLMLDPAVRQALSGPRAPDDLTVRAVAAVLVRNLVQQRGGQLQISALDNAPLVFGVILPRAD